MEIVIYRIVGVSPMLQHNPAAMEQKSGSLATKKTYNDQEEAEKRVYRNSAGQFYIPSLQFRAAMLNGCKGRKIGKVGAATVIAGAVFNSEMECPILDATTMKPIKNYEIHKTRVVVQRNAVFRCRPQFNNWATRLALEVDREMLPDLQVITDVLNVAGRIAGVGDFGPRNRGIYGRFTAELEQ